MSPTALTDLWPDDLDPVATAEPTPVAVLRLQGQLLGKRTGNAVYGEVRSEQVGSGPSEKRPNEFMHTFLLTSGYVRYTRALLFVRHGLSPYPASFVALKTDGSGDHYMTSKIATVKELETALKETFGRDDVKDLIRALRLQSQDYSE